MKVISTALTGLLLSGCVASTDVKQASLQLGTALDQLTHAQNSLRDIYIQEIEEVSDLTASAIESRSVSETIKKLESQEVDGNLLVLSQSISSDREATRALVSEVRAASVKSHQNTDEILDAILKKRINDLRSTANLFGNTITANELRERANALQFETSGRASGGLYQDLNNLLSLNQAKSEITDSLNDLNQYIEILKTMHNGVNDWIATDVTVDGSSIADLLIKAEQAN